MKLYPASGRAPLCVALSLAFALAACGGGPDDLAATDVASTPPVASAGDAATDGTKVAPGVPARDGTAVAGSAPTTADPADVPAEPAMVLTGDDAPIGDTVQYTVRPDEFVLNNLFAAGLDHWTVGDAVLVPSTARPGGQAINVGWRALQTFTNGAIVPRASYVVKFRARNEKATGNTTVAMKFQIPPYNENFRIHKVQVTSTQWADYSFEFTAPVYTKGELSILANGSRTIVDGISMKMRSAIPVTEAKAMPSGSLVPRGYSMVFNDEFNGTTLNRAKWHTRMVYNNGTADRMHDEKQRYRDNDNHRVANGVLSLVARKVSETDPDGINYESGMIRSDWTARHGFFEARVKMPGGIGVWPAFWLNSDVSEGGRLSWPPEIDIFEFVNNGVEDKVNMLHSNVVTRDRKPSQVFYADPAFNQQHTFWRAPYNFNDGFHVIGAEWTPTQLTLYIDGKKIYTRAVTWTYDDGTPGGPAHILLNFAVGGAWAGRYGIDDTAFPQTMDIDWVRVYQKL